MEATGRDGDAGGPSWSYRERHEYIESSSYTISGSSRSGTIVSSATYTSGASRFSYGGFSMETAISTEAAALLKLELEFEPRLGTLEPDVKDAEFAQAIKKRRKEIDGETTWKEWRMKHTECMVQEFLGGSGGGMSALERWFSELEVCQVFKLCEGWGWQGLHPRLCGHTWYPIWIQTLKQIMETVDLTNSFFPNNGISEQELGSGKQATSLDPLQFALFFQKAMATMLIFVDIMFSKPICIKERLGPEDTSLVPLSSCLKVNRALSEVLSRFRLQFYSSPPAKVEEIEKEMVSLLSAKQEKAFDAIWSALDNIWTRILKSMEDSLGAQTPQGSTDIHQATSTVMNHIEFLLYNCWAVDPLFVSQAVSLGKYVPPTGLEEAQPFVSIIAEMVFCLEIKLINKSQSFLDKGLGLLFLLNNSNFIWEKLQDSLSCVGVDFAAIISSITRKVEHYAESYLQVSWEPMLARLFNPTPLRLVRKYSPLSKFESEFQKIYTTQKLWKVPDPELRNRLRKAVIDKIIPGYTKYIEDSKVTNPKFTPQELEEMLQELFEG